jgi:hypothetical protein
LFILGGLGIQLLIMLGLIGQDGGLVDIMAVIIHDDGEMNVFILYDLSPPDPGEDTEDMLIQAASLNPLQNINLSSYLLE